MATIGDLVVNLTANTNPLTRGLGVGQSSIRSFVGMATRLVAPLAGLFGAGIALGAARDQAKQERLLQATLNSTGNAAGFSASQIADYAEELQAITGIADDVTMSAAGVLATFTKVNGDVFKDGIRLAQDMSARLGGDLQSSILQIGKALNDPARGMTALRKAGVSFTQQQVEQIKALQESGNLLQAQKMIIAELSTEFAGAAAAAADPWELAKANIGEAAETMGFVMLPAVNVVAEQFGKLFGAIAANGDEARRLGAEISALAKNFGGILELAILKNKLLFGQMFAEVAHFFGSSIPAFLGWFTTNWRAALLTVFDLASTVFINIGENLKEIWTEIWDFITSAGTDAVEFSWTPLLEGAEHALNALPDIPERAIGQWEQDLIDEIDALGGSVGQSIAQDFEREVRKLDITAGVFKPGAASKDEAGSAKKKSQQSTDNAALERGSSEAFSAIVKAMNQQQFNAQKLTAQNTKQANVYLQSIKKDMAKVAASATPEQVIGAFF